jgi:cellulose biosynthesis protein BcsQ
MFHQMNKQMKKKPIYVAFSTQKGGAGKTTLTVLVASYLHYVRGYNVAVIDYDYPQHSIAEMRERDLKLVMEDNYYEGMAYEQFSRIDRKAYPVIESNTQEAIADAEYLIPQDDYDFIFFDLPGTMNNEYMIHALAEIDYLIAPISADRVVLESTLNYLLVVKDHIMQPGKSNIRNLYLLWNMVDGREKSELYEVYEAVIGDLGFSLFKTFLPDTKRFRREQSVNHKALFRSTLFPADKTLLKGSNLEMLADEFLQRVK